MRFFYNIAITIYYFLILFFSVFNKKAYLWKKGRQNVLFDLKEQINPDKKYLWIHAASMGEFEQGRPVIEAYKKKSPDISILLTFFSPSGYEARKDYTGADIIIYLPFDFTRNVKRFLEIARPETAIFIKYEFWYNYLNQLNKRNIPTYLISGIFRENHIFFKCYGKWFRKALCAYKHFFVQNESSSLLLQSIGLKNITVCGDTRFDRVLAISEKSGDNEILENFKAGKQILIGGSTWDRDENIIIEFINNSENELKFIIVPHEINDSQIDEIIEKLKVKTVKYSRASENNLIGAVVMIIDNVGMLSSIYKYANIAYIGGGFGAGIHNVLEPASFGMPVLFGPNYQNFEEAKELITRGGAFSVNNYQQFSDVVNSLLTDKKKLKNSSEISFGFIKESIGATSIIVNELISD